MMFPVSWPPKLFLPAHMAGNTVSDADVCEIRKALASWTVKRYRTWRDNQDSATRDIMTIPHDATIEDALRALSRRGVLSAPVVHVTTGDYLGFFSAGDALTKLLVELFPSICDAKLTTPAAMAEALARNASTVDNIAQWARDGFLSEHIVRPGSNNDGDLSYAGFDETTLLDLVSRGLKRSPSAEVRRGDFEPSHRIAIYEEASNGKMRIADIVSQSDTLRALLSAPDQLGPWAGNATVDDVFGQSPVLCVPADLPAIGAFALMHNTDISGVGVTDPSTAKLVAHLTVADLRCLTSASDFDLLRLPALKFFAQQRQECSTEEPTHQSPVVTVRPGDTVLHLMRALVDGKAHRAYVIDETGVPVGVVTLTDLLRLFAVDPASDKEMLLTF